MVNEAIVNLEIITMMADKLASISTLTNGEFMLPTMLSSKFTSIIAILVEQEQFTAN